MLEPIVSVVIPTRNRPTSLGRAVQSVLDQTYGNLEVIVVDDASDPPVGPMLAEFGDSRILYMRGSERKGASASRNAGIETAKGQFVSFLDDDDRYYKTKIAEQMQVFERCSRSIGLVYCGYIFLDEGDRVIWKTEPRKSKWDYLYHNEYIGISPLVRRECFDDFGLFDEEMTHFEDLDMWFRISQKYEFGLCDKLLYEVVSRPASRSKRELSDKLSSLDYYYHKHWEKYRPLTRKVHKRVLSRYYLERALSYYHTDTASEMRGEVVKSLSFYPLSFKCLKLLLYSVAGVRGRSWLRNVVGSVRRRRL